MQFSRRSYTLHIACGVLLAGCILLAGCSKSKGTPSPGAAVSASNAGGMLVTALVHRETMAIKVNSTGTVEPIRTIEIKSKASGKILRLPVEVGDFVEAGALLAQVDTADVAVALRQREADLAYARAQYTIADGRKRRSDDLLTRGMVSSDDHDATVLEYTRARAALVNAEAALDQARERVQETIVRAPARGTVIEKSVEEGQIIASATSQVTGGTTLMKMADLSTMQVRVLVQETDLGKIRAGQHVTITASAYPNRQFEGTILKVEPKAKKINDVVYYPALVRVDNREELLLPDMTCNVEVDVVRKDNALVISTEALVRPQEAHSVATLLGIDSTLVDTALTKVGARAGSGPDLSNLPPWMMSRQAAAELRAASGATGLQDVGIVFAHDSAGIHPVAVRVGLKDWNLTEVASGLREGQEIIVPPSSTVAQQFKEFYAMLARIGGGGLPGKK